MECYSPIDHSDPIIRLWILRSQFNVPLMERFRFFHYLGVEWIPGKVIEDCVCTVDGCYVVRVFLQEFFKNAKRQMASLHVARRCIARNKFSGVGGPKIQLGIHKGWVKLFGSFEILDGAGDLAILKGSDTVVEVLPCLNALLGHLLLAAALLVNASQRRVAE